MTPSLHRSCLACAGSAPLSPCPRLVDNTVVSVPPPPPPAAAILLYPRHRCQRTSLVSDASSLAILADADADVMTVALGFDDADADTFVACSSAAAAAQRRRCNHQPPPKATSQRRRATAIFQHHRCVSTIFQCSIRIDCCVLIFFF
jgi:hypothetical protein